MSMSTRFLSSAVARRCPSCRVPLREWRRLASTTTASQNEAGSLFSDRSPAWEFFSNSSVTSTPPKYQSSEPARDSPIQSSPPRQAMTARESNAFNEMFEMIFNAVDAHEKRANAAPVYDPSIGVGRGAVDDLIGRLRKYPRSLKLTKSTNEILDRQLEAMDSCATDQELLEWATKELFGESQRYEKEAREFLSTSTSTGSMTELPALQPPTYPLLLARLIKIFREKYGDPHLALAMFNHARHLSIASYVFGCTAQVHNEVMQTYWDCFRDLKNILQTLEEMKTNVVKVDTQTRKLIDSIRRGVAEQSLWSEESEVGGERVWDLLAKIEEHARIGAPRESTAPLRNTHKPNWDFWKTSPLEDVDDDDWGFNSWGKEAEKQSGNKTVPGMGGRRRRFGLRG